MEYKLIKTEYLEMVSGGDNSILHDLIDIFKGQATEFVSEMWGLFNVSDYPNLGLLAHKAKSSVAIMGMDEMAALLKKFESEAKQGINSDHYKGYIEQFENNIKEAVKELEHYSGKA